MTLGRQLTWFCTDIFWEVPFSGKAHPELSVNILENFSSEFSLLVPVILMHRALKCFIRDFLKAEGNVLLWQNQCLKCRKAEARTEKANRNQAEHNLRHVKSWKIRVFQIIAFTGKFYFLSLFVKHGTMDLLRFRWKPQSATNFKF